jgi:diguanylate cyclase (GGDEF)-like protein
MGNQLAAERGSGSPALGAMDAVGKILEANQQLKGQLHEAHQRLEEQAHEIEMHATHALTDSLTSLANRRAFDAELTRRVAESARYGAPLSLMLLDIDHFKQFNDQYGHHAGDLVLIEVAKALKAVMRIPDFVARYGGEEFAIIMPHTAMEQIPLCAERVRARIEETRCDFEGQSLQVTASAGVAQFIRGQKSGDLLRCADDALYAAKHAGRNRVHFCAAPRTEQTAQGISGAAVAETDGKTSALVVARGHSENKDLRTDAATGLPTRLAFLEDLRRRQSEAMRYGTRFSLMFIKIDNLAELMKQHGTAMGGLVVRVFTQFLSAAMREMDVVTRYGEELFGIILPGTALVDAAGAGERLRSAIQRSPLPLMKRKIHLSISVGLAESTDGEELEQLLERAQEAMAASVGIGGNGVHFHNGVSIDGYTGASLAALNGRFELVAAGCV